LQLPLIERIELEKFPTLGKPILPFLYGKKRGIEPPIKLKLPGPKKKIIGIIKLRWNKMDNNSRKKHRHKPEEKVNYK
jgi:hypothetical protein